jgi:acyl-coenzyme A synthetase/AMP-(fatty) acid ligase
MLDERWRQIVARHPDELAVYDAASGDSWTFARLACEADSVRLSDAGPISTPRGRDVGFILEVLRAWRAGLPVCPLEPGQAAPDVPIPPAGIAHLKLTSGSTGMPRAIALTAGQLAADADHIVSTMGLRPDCPNLGVISLAHSYGFSNLVTPLLLHGIPLILAPSPLPAAITEAARNWRQLTLPAVPALWRTWRDAEAIPPNLRLAISAGAPLPLPLEEAVFARWGVKIHNFIGASECGGIAFDRSKTPRTDPTCTGTAMDGVRLAADETGQLIVSSPAVASTYWPEADERLGGGTFRSTDLVAIDPDGQLRVLGRASDLINVAGRKVSPETVEQALLAHPSVRDCIAFGIGDEASRGEAVAIVYALRDSVSETALRSFLAARLPPWQVPRHWWHCDDLGVDSRGKRSRAGWRTRFAERG